jgi:hypothetical protein
MNLIIGKIVLQIACAMVLILITGFFAIHAAQHVSDPVERSVWLLIIIPFTLFGSAFYVFTKYRAFQNIGKGRLVRGRKPKSFKEFIALSEDEKRFGERGQEIILQQTRVDR